MKFIKFLIPLFVLALLVGCTPTPPTDSTQTDGYSSENISTPSSSPAMQPNTGTTSGFNGQMLKGKHTIVMKTSMGDITIELDADKAPKTVTNFVTLSKMGYYNGLTFHRVIPDFMIQGGDPDGRGTGGTSIYGDSFEDESNDLKMERGVLAMANRGPNTNGSQFFITQVETPWLQGLHTIFGKVTAGMNVVDAIAKVQRGPNDMPVTAVTYDIEVKN